MPTALLVLASAPSKLPFYLVGGCLAAWAVVLAATGLSRPDFPGSRVRARGVMGVSGLLVAGTIGAAIATASKPKHEAAAATPTKPGAATSTVKLAADPGGQLRYNTKSLTAKAGTVTIDFTNQSPITHNVTIEAGGKAIGGTKTISSSVTTASVALKPGTYTFFCSVDAHRAAGMQGTLKVS
jgi:plastocyanin